MAKLLLVEDDEFSRDFLARRLERSGYEVLSAADGRESLRCARLHRPDLILMDLDMPVMDGKTAIRHLRIDPRTSRFRSSSSPRIPPPKRSRMPPSPAATRSKQNRWCSAACLDRIAEILEVNRPIPDTRRPVVTQPRPHQQRLRIGLPSHKPAVQLGGIFAVALRQNVRAEFAADLPAEDPAVAEPRERVRIQHLRPLIRVIPGAVAHRTAEQCVNAAIMACSAGSGAGLNSCSTARVYATGSPSRSGE